MARRRIHELAKELDMESKEIINKLAQIGVNVKSHMSTLEEKETERLLQHLGKDKVASPAKNNSAGRGRQVEKKKETTSPDAKKLEKGKSKAYQGERRRGGRAERGTGLVDRVPSRPPDRRFQEKPKHVEKSGRRGQPRSEHGMQSKAAQVQDRSRKGRPLQESAQQKGSRQDSFKQERGPHDRNQVKPLPDRASQERVAPKPDDRRQDAVHKPDAEARPRPPRAEERGPRSAAPQGTRSKPVDRRPVHAGAGQAARLQSEQAAAVRPADGKRLSVGEKQKTSDKKAKQGSQKPAAKGRFDKRTATAKKAGMRRASSSRKKGAPRGQQRIQKPVQPVEKKPIVMGESTTVQELALKMHKSPAELIKKLMNLGVLVTINQDIDADTATILAGELGYEVVVKVPVDIEAVLMQEPEEDPALLQPRPCVVTVMGHVDHGKTSLLDAIRKANVTATEAGGITQHIGAYQVEHNGKKITFLDTPGHEAFTAMRARGAQVTDIAILVVAADDGVMPQTVEAINHAKEAGVPIIVAINKIDKPAANPDRVKQELTEHGLVAEEWGGDNICVNVSALKREGLKELIEMVQLVAEMNELKANPKRPARGTVIEAELDKGRGPVAAVLVQNGTLNVGDTIIAGPAFGRVRAMMDDKGRRVKKAVPSTPVEVLGFSGVPAAGDVFIVVEDEKLARSIVDRRQTRKREEELRVTSRVSLEDLFKHIQEGQIKELGIIIKGDVQGSVEALRQALERLNTGEVKVNIIHGGVGAITETDINLASASNAIIIGFNVRPDVNARRAAENEKVDVRLYRVIYDAIEDVKASMSGLLDPEYREVMLGRAEVRKIFKASRIGTIAGCYVLEGKVERDAGIRVVRDGIVIHEGKLDSLKRFKDDVKEVMEGYECGLALEKYNEIQEGDIIEIFTIEAIKRKLHPDGK